MWGIRFLQGGATIAFWSGAIALIVALAGPGIVTRERIYLNRGIDIMVVLDLSPSMSARDFGPLSRFEAARTVIRNFIEQRKNDSIGLVGFGSESALYVPPTINYDYLFDALDRLEIVSLGDGSAIGMGVALAALHLRSGSASRRVIILLTDGKNNAGEIPPETAARVAAQMGISIYTIGVGANEETPFEFREPDSGRLFRGVLTDGFDESLLRSIAEQSAGSYFYAGSVGTLDAVFRSIDSIETVERRTRIRVDTEPLEHLFILITIGCFLFNFLIRRLLLREVL